MKPEYDFSRAERGKFHCTGPLKLPAYAKLPKEAAAARRENGATSSKEKDCGTVYPSSCVSGDKDDQ